MNNDLNLNKPKPPLSRVTNFSRQVGICLNCGSSLVYMKWYYFFGKKQCLNKECDECRRNK